MRAASRNRPSLFTVLAFVSGLGTGILVSLRPASAVSSASAEDAANRARAAVAPPASVSLATQELGGFSAARSPTMEQLAGLRAQVQDLQQANETVGDQYLRAEERCDQLQRRFDQAQCEIEDLRREIGQGAWVEFQKDPLYAGLAPEAREAVAEVFEQLGKRPTDVEILDLAYWYPDFRHRDREALDKWQRPAPGTSAADLERYRQDSLLLMQEQKAQYIRILGRERARKCLPSCFCDELEEPR